MANKGHVLRIMKRQLFAFVPEEFMGSFNASRFVTNCLRFSAQSLVIAFIDIIALLLLFLNTRNVDNSYVLIYAAKILLMLMLGFVFSQVTEESFNPKNRVHKNIHILYPIIHFFCEFALFIAGPGDLGSLIRLISMPFIIAGFTVVEQKKSVFMQLIFCASSFAYIPYSGLGALSVSWSTLYTFIAIIFICSNLISFTVYSWFVNNHISSERVQKAQKSVMQLNEQLEETSRLDPLTGLLNRRGFTRCFEDKWDSYVGQDDTLSIVMLDIDQFKKYNDYYGHVAGDDCIKRVSAAITEGTPDAEHIFSRYGGEEFVLVIYGMEHQRVLECVNTIHNNIMELKIPHPSSDVSAFVTISIGIASINAGALDSSEELISWADECLSFAKKSGRNRIIHTHMERGMFMDIHNTLLVSEKRGLHYPLTSYSNTSQILNDLGANCSFVYNSGSKSLRFSKQSADTFGLPLNYESLSLEDAVKAMPISIQDKGPLTRLITNCIRDRQTSFYAEIHIEKNSQELIPVAMSGECCYDNDGSFASCFGSMMSITHMMDYDRFLKSRTMTNGVTLLPNRDRFMSDIRDVLNENSSQGFMIFMDIVEFSEINAHYSHTIGDKLLKEVAFQLSKIMMGDKNLSIYNYDVDQFLVLARECEREKAENIMNAVHSFFASTAMQDSTYKLHVSFAMVALPYSSEATDIDRLFLDMDMAINAAKIHKSEPYVFFEDELKKMASAHLELKYHLKKAVENNFEGFSLYYQPIVEALSGKWVGAEALIRWENQYGEIMSPDVIVPALEQIEIMGAVDEWVLNNAAWQCRQWINHGVDKNFFINVNLSSRDIDRSSLGADVQEVMRSNNLMYGNITLEVTESFSMVDQKVALDSLERLKNMGMKVAIDDFGTGYSSLNYLGALPANEVKIDRSFVQGIEHSESARKFIFAIIGMIKSMGFLVCVEGVENKEQLNYLMQTKVDLLQGFYFSKPAPPADFLAAMEHSEQLNSSKLSVVNYI